MSNSDLVVVKTRVEAGSLGEDDCAGSQLGIIVSSTGHGLPHEAISLGLFRTWSPGPWSREFSGVNAS